MEGKLKEEVEATIAKYPKAFTGRVCGFKMFDKADGAYVGGHLSSAVCHADLTYDIRTPVIVVNGHKATWNKINPEFLKWVFTEAPYNHGILNRDNEDQWRNQCGVYDSDLIGRGGILWSCKAARHFQEDTWKLKTWDALRNEGLNGLQAFIGADMLDSEGDPMKGSHCGLVGYDKPVEIRKIYDKLRVADRNDTNQANHRGPWDYNEVWGSMKGKKVKKSDGWGGFIEQHQPGNAKDYAAAIKEICEGDPKNVK